MLPDALDAPNDAGYAVGETEPLGPNMADDGFINGLASFSMSAAVLLSFFVVGGLLALVAKRLGIRRPLSLLILLVSFAPAILHAQYVQKSVMRVLSGPPTTKMETLRLAATAFVSTSLWSAVAVFTLGALFVWHVPRTVLLAPFVCTAVYVVFPLQSLLAAVVGTDVLIDNLAHGWLGVEVFLLTFGILGWLLGRDIVAALRHRLERRLSQ